MTRTQRFQLALLGCGAALAAAVFVAHPGDALLYNHSPSMPVGLYARTDAPVAAGAIVTVRARDVAPSQARDRGFDGEGHRFIKRIVAVGGDLVCMADEHLTVNSQPVAAIGAALPASGPAHWDGCRRLSADEALLLGDTPDSFDGRYWGPISIHLIEGVWRKL
jgi:type IV secretory pathway protease TraF